MNDFIKAFEKHEKACAQSISWLNENASFLSESWHIWHSGGGLTHYRAEGSVEGRKCFFLLCHDNTAEPDLVQKEACWTLSANEVDKDGEEVAFAVLADGFADARGAVEAAKVAIQSPEWEDPTAPPAPR